MIHPQIGLTESRHNPLISSSTNREGYYSYSITFIRIIGQTTGDGGFSHVQKEIR